MITDKFVKGYAVLKSRWLKNNILEEYLCFVATIIIEENMIDIDENIICKKFLEKYNIKFQPTFVRQILSYAVGKNVIVKNREKFTVDASAIKKYKIDLESFDADFDLLIKEFLSYANNRKYYPEEKGLEQNIYSFVDKYDDHVLYNNFGDINVGDSSFLYHWCNYILYLKDEKPYLYAFFVGVCSANLVKTALFYTGEIRHATTNLRLYLDTPMIFALLGMDTPERKEAYEYLLKKASSIGMSLFVFDHNFEEAKGIMERASRWALSSDYDPEKSNKVTQFFHDSGMSYEEIMEFIHDFEPALNSIGITQEITNYIADQDQFQLDENNLSEAIKKEYGNRAQKFNSEEMYDNSIKTDVRSLVMIQRKRAGIYSTDLKSSRCIFVTTNGVIAKVSKDFTLDDELTRDKIPTSVTADIFGTLLWLDFPEANDYPSYKMIADCKALLKPTSKMIATFILELDKAYKRGDTDLTEDKFLFLRSHPIVKTILLDATSGDYSQFTSNIWSEVYNRIISKAEYNGEQKYRQEKEEHFITQSKLETTKSDLEQEKERGKDLEERLENQADKFASVLSTIVSICIFAVPYIALSLLVIFIQSNYFDWTAKGITLCVLTVLGALLPPILFKKLKEKLKKYFKLRFFTTNS